MISNVAKWGNSLAVRIPRDAARQLQIGEGGQVEIAVEGGALVLRPVAVRTSHDLDSLLAGITEENLHAEIGAGAAVGNEL